MVPATGDGLVATGCYSEPVPHAPAAHGEGVQIRDANRPTGAATVLATAGELVNPAFLIRHPSLPVLYVGSESWTAAGAVSSLIFSPDFTTILASVTLPSGGDQPCYLTVVSS